MEFKIEVNEVVGQKILQASEYFGCTSGEYLRFRVVEMVAREYLIADPGQEMKTPLKVFAAIGLISCPSCTAKMTPEMIDAEACSSCGEPFKSP